MTERDRRIDEARAACRRFLAVTDGRHPGLATWVIAVGRTAEAAKEKLTELLEGRE